MMYFGAGRPCPYAITPCVVLNRDETPVFLDPTHPDYADVRREAENFLSRHKCQTLFGFGGRFLTLDEGPPKTACRRAGTERKPKASEPSPKPARRQGKSPKKPKPGEYTFDVFGEM